MLPFYHFSTANKKATLRKVHSREELFSFLKKLNLSSDTRLSSGNIGLGLLIFSPRSVSSCISSW